MVFTFMWFRFFRKWKFRWLYRKWYLFKK